MKIKNIFFLIIISAFILIVSFSCSSNKKIVKVNKEIINSDELLMRINNNALKYNTFSTNYAANINYDNKNLDLSGKIKIANDSIIWISANALFGIEIARILITNDSIFLLNRLERWYASESINKISNKTGIPLKLNLLQNVLTGNYINISQNLKINNDNNSSNNYELFGEIKLNSNNYSIDTKNKDIIHTSIINKADYKVFETKFKSDDIFIETENKNFKTIENQTIPTSIRAVANISSKEADITFNYNNYQINNKEKFTFIIPKSYTRKEF